ncbi:hypothetical protein FOL47_006568 [Perkinsus chesapeaki]|uniref:W2 domain-containing protein n=1 Tax=Perkinsus chesapeaki TaxID=330153 RepID=A0A7J6MXX4_PERCH|nr:hypothetical protein FOL47_006568 [Perkinsus chesapeaki]
MGGKRGGAAKQHKAAVAADDDSTSSQYTVNACIIMAENFDEGCETDIVFEDDNNQHITGLLTLPGDTTLLQRNVDLAIDTLHMGNVYVICRQSNLSIIENTLTRSKRMTVTAVPDTFSDILTNVVVGTGGSGEAKGDLNDTLRKEGITTGELLHWSNGIDSTSSKVELSEPLLHWGFGATSKFNEIHYRTGILGDGALGDVFSPDVFRLLEEEADYKSLRDDLVKLTIGAKFDDGVCPFGIGACIVPSLPHQLIRVTSPRSYFEAAVTMMLDKSPRDFLVPWPTHNIESKHLYASKDAKWIEGGDHLTYANGCEVAYVDSRASVDPSATLNNCYIAPGATIEKGVTIDSSIIGPNTIVKAGASIKRSILHSQCIVSPSTGVECATLPHNTCVDNTVVNTPISGITIGTTLPDIDEELRKMEARSAASTVESSEEGQKDTMVEDVPTMLADDDKAEGAALKDGFRAEVYAFFKEGWQEKQDVGHVCQQLRIYRTTEQAPLPELLAATVLALARVCCDVITYNSGKAKQPLVTSFYEYWDDALDELYLTEQSDISKWWMDALDALCEYCLHQGGDLERECCLFIWGMYTNDILSKDDLLAWWAQASDTYRNLPLMTQLVGQVEDDSDSDDDSDSGDESDDSEDD